MMQKSGAEPFAATLFTSDEEQLILVLIWWHRLQILSNTSSNCLLGAYIILAKTIGENNIHGKERKLKEECVNPLFL